MNLLNEIGSDLTGLEQLKVMMTQDRRPGLGETLDIRLIEVEQGRVVLEATPDVHLYNPLGTVHGGFAATMLAFACGYAVLSKLTSGMNFATLELEMAYLQAHHQGYRPHSCRGNHRDDGMAGGVHGGSTGGCGWPAVRLGYVKPSVDATDLNELGPGSGAKPLQSAMG